MRTRLVGFPQRHADVLLLDEPHRSVLIAPGQVESHVLNATARAIWELCDGATHPDEMAGAICQVFSVAADVARADVLDALEQLTATGLVTWSDSADGMQR